MRSSCFWIYENEFTDHGDRSLRLHRVHDASHRWGDIDHPSISEGFPLENRWILLNMVGVIYEMYRDLYAVEGFDLRDL